MLPPQDLKILDVLQQDGRISNQELAERVNMSNSACWRHLQSLKDAGIIDHFAAILDPEKCGLRFHAIAQVFITRHEQEYQREFLDTISDRPEVMDCFSIAGDADYILRILCKDKNEYNRLLEECFFKIQGVHNVRTSLILKEIVQKTDIPIQTQ